MKVRFVLCASLLLAAGIAESQEPSQVPRVKAEQKADQPPQPNSNTNPPKAISEKPPLVVPKAITKSGSKEAKKHTNENSHEASESWLIFGYNVKITDSLLVIFTALLFIATWLLWRATAMLVKGAADTAERQLRAYVFVKPDMVRTFPSLDRWHNHGVKFIINNSGQTPAYDLQHIISIGIFDLPLTSSLPVDFPSTGSKAVLNPSAYSETLIATSHQLTESERADISSRRKAIFIWGEIRYRDAFDEPRWSKFRMMYQSSGTGSLDWCESGNEAN